MYIQAILKNGFLLPVLLGGIFWFGATKAVSKFEDKKLKKENTFAEHQSNKNNLELYKNIVTKNKNKLLNWKNILQKNPQDKLIDNKQNLNVKLNNDRIVKLNEKPKSGTSKLIAGSTLKGKINTYNFTQEWIGSMQELQKMLIIQETNLPETTLETLTLSPNKSQALGIPALSLKLTYIMYDQPITLKNKLEAGKNED